jgi:hypothetical protein
MVVGRRVGVRVLFDMAGCGALFWKAFLEGCAGGVLCSGGLVLSDGMGAIVWCILVFIGNLFGGSDGCLAKPLMVGDQAESLILAQNERWRRA